MVYMSIIENIKKQNKKKQQKNIISYPTALFSVGRHFDVVKILPNQQEGTETGKDSIWIKQSIYKCTKIYTLYKEGAILCYFLIFCCKSVCLGRNYFLKDWTGRSWRGPSVL